MPTIVGGLFCRQIEMLGLEIESRCKAALGYSRFRLTKWIRRYLDVLILPSPGSTCKVKLTPWLSYRISPMEATRQITEEMACRHTEQYRNVVAARMIKNA